MVQCFQSLSVRWVQYFPCLWGLWGRSPVPWALSARCLLHRLVPWVRGFLIPWAQLGQLDRLPGLLARLIRWFPIQLGLSVRCFPWRKALWVQWARCLILRVLLGPLDRGDRGGHVHHGGLVRPRNPR